MRTLKICTSFPNLFKTVEGQTRQYNLDLRIQQLLKLISLSTTFIIQILIFIQ